MSGIEAIYRLSPLQRGLLFHSLYAPESGVYVEQMSCLLCGSLDLAAFERAWQQVLDRHAVLRTAFVWEGVEEPVQVVRRQVKLPLALEDWRGLAPAEQQRRLTARVAEERRRPLQLNAPPLLRLTLARVAEDAYRLLLCNSHLLLDGWSRAVVLGEVLAWYAACRAGRDLALPLPPPFRSWIAWLEKQDQAGAESFWRETLRGFVPVPLAVRVQPADGVPAAPSADATQLLPAAASASLRALARRHRLTLNTLVQGCWAALLHRYTGSSDVAFGITLAGRPPEIEGSDGMVGLFINTLPLRLRVAPRQPLLPWLAEVQSRAAALRRHEHSALAEVQRWSDAAGGQPLFDTLLVYESYPVPEALAGTGADIAVGDVRNHVSTHYPVVAIVEPGARMELRLACDPARFGQVEARRLAEHLGNLLAGAATGLDRRLEELSPLAPGERFQLLCEWSGAAAGYPVASIQELFAAQALRTPEALAVVQGDEALSYGELARRARRLARFLIRQGVRPGDRVGLHLERSPEMVVGLLAILGAGAAYLALDPGYPPERLAYMAADAEVETLISSARSAPTLPPPAARQVNLDRDAAAIARHDGLDPAVRTTLDDLAYVSYTSGSTGLPKGVEVLHRGVVRLLFGAGYADLDAPWMLQLSPLAFDASTLEIWGPLLHGGRCVLMPAGVPAVAELGQVLHEQAVDTLWLTSSLFNVVIDQQPDALAGARQLLIGGEALSVQHVMAARERFPGLAIVNGYGPTENTTFTCCHLLPRRCGPAPASIPIGRPLGNTSVYLLDAALEPVPAGVAGELYTGGDGLARGYLRRPALTAARFVPDPWAAVPGGRLYRTGDLARFLGDGTLEFIGRIDQQVKVRGFRIEPGEVEAALLRHPALREAAVIASADGAAGKRLVAYFVAGSEPAPSAAELRAFAAASLPEPMVPAVFVRLEALPLNAHGKLDRGRLPLPDTAEPVPGQRPPAGVAEELMAAIWAQVLGRERVGADDDFFALGGHSLLAMQLVSRLRTVFGVELPLRALFDAPSVAGLTARLGSSAALAAAAAPPILPAPREPAPPLSFAQQRLWFVEQLVGAAGAYNLATALRLRGPLALAACRASLDEIVRRHESLRTTFEIRGGRPVQVIRAAAPVPVPVVDLARLPAALREAAAGEIAAAEARRPYDLERGPVVRLRLLRLAPDECLLLLGMHHIAADGWSMGVALREMSALYCAFLAGRRSPLAELPVQYADFAVWQRQWLRGEVLAAQLEHWRRALGGELPALRLPIDRPRPAVPSYRGGRVAVGLDRQLGSRLGQRSRQQGATPFMALLGAFQVVLGRLGDQQEVVVGTPVANRSRQEIEELIGCFVNVLALRGDLGGDPPFRLLLGRLREVALGAYAHQDVPFEKLVEELHPERDVSRAPVFQVVLVLQNTPAVAARLEGIAATPVALATGTAKFDLLLALEGDDAGGFSGSLEYASDLFDAATAERLAGQFMRLLAAAVADPECRLSELPLVGDVERRQLLGWAGAGAAWQPELPLHRQFEARARRTPDAVAAVCAAAALTYGELERRANRLARHLRRCGAGAGDRVGLCLPRSLELIAGILGTLKAGAAYLPLDAAYPPERLAFMAADAAVAAVVTVAAAAAALPELAVPVVWLDRDRAAIAAEDPAPPDGGAELPAAAAAYVIYTSGSSGRPKGVVVAHANVARLFLATAAWFAFGAGDVWTLFHSYAFDFSVWEVWGALLYGGRLVVVPYWVSRSPELLLELLAAERVTVLNQTPSAFRQLSAAEELPSARHRLALRQVVFGGEALDFGSLRGWLLRHGDEAPRLVNMYGITETTVHVTYRRVFLADAVGTPANQIGAPLPDLDLHVLDRWQQLLPVGTPGELCVAGDGLAWGYLGRPELSAQRFVPNLFGRRRGERLYRSGDLGRRLPGGEIEYLGRIDQQVKLRGFRIELGEIEALLGSHPGVREAAVVLRDWGRGEPGLVAYLVGRAGAVPAAEELRAHLLRELPGYMVPSVFVALPALPLTANGKLDRQALPDPGARHGEEAGEVAPRTPREAAMAAIWGEVLGVERVGVHDNFFALGGDSILSLTVRARARAAGLDFQLQQLFEHQTVARLVDALGDGDGRGLERSAAAPFSLVAAADLPLLPAGLEDACPLTALQSGMLFHGEFHATATAYHDVLSFHLRAPFDAAALRQALAELMAGHGVLRTSFDLTRFSEPLQLVWSRIEPPLRLGDLRHLSGEEQQARLAALAEEERRRQFDWRQAPLLRAWIHRRSAESFQLTLGFHHAILDGWSLAAALTELVRRYLALQGGSEPPPAAPRLAFTSCVALERAALADPASRRHWLERLEGARPTLLGVTGPDAAGERRSAALHADLPEELAAGVIDLARREGVPLKSVLLAAHVAVLREAAGSEDVLTGMVTNSRPEEAEGERVLGLFLNTLPLRLRCGAESWRQLIHQVFDLEREQLPHRRYPLAEISRLFGGRALFGTVFNFTHFHVYRALDGIGGIELLDGRFDEETNFPFVVTWSLDLSGSRLQRRIEYDGGSVSSQRATLLGDGYVRALAAMVAAPADSPGAARLLPELASQEARLAAAASPPLRAASGRPQEVAAAAGGGTVPAAAGDAATHAEAVLAAIWARVLRVPRVTAGDNFFELGGDSILSLQVVARAREAGLQLTPQLLFESRTLAELAAAAGRTSPPRPAAPRQAAAGPQPLTPIQAWLLERGLPQPHHWNQALLLAVAAPLDPGRLAAALAALTVHHEALRLRFIPAAADAHDWRQQAVATAAAAALAQVDLAALPPPRRRPALEAAAALAQASLDLERGPLHRALLFHLGAPAAAAAPWRLLLICHHLIVDGVSWRILLDDLAVAYRQLAARRPVELPAAGSFTLWACRLAEYARRGEAAAELPFWQAAAAAGGRLPADLAGGARSAERATSVAVALDAPATAALLHEAPRAYRTRIDDLLLTALAQTLCRASGAPAVRVDLEGHGREALFPELDLARTVGWFTALYPVRLAPGEGGPGAAIRRVKEQLRAVPRGGIGYGVLRYLRSGGGEAAAALRGVPPAEVSFNYLGQLDQALPDDSPFAAAPENAGPAQGGGGRAYPLEITASVRGGRLEAVFTCCCQETGPRSALERLAGDFLDDLSALLGHCTSPAAGGCTPSDFPLAALSQEALDRVVGQGGGIEDLYPLAPLQEGLLFEALLAPDSTAYFEQFSFRLGGHLDRGAFVQAWQQVVDRNPILRTDFRWQGLERPLQAVHRRVELPWTHADWRGTPAERQDAWFEEHLESDRRRGFDAATAPLLRCALLRTAEREQLFVWSHHHLLLDGWCLSLIVREVFLLYRAALSGAPATLPHRRPYRDYIAWLERQDGAAAEAFWRAALAGFVRPTPLPEDRAAAAGAAAVEPGERRAEIDAAQTARLLAFARRRQLTLGTLMHAVWALLLARSSGEREVVFGSVVAGRPADLPGADAMVGLFINTLPWRAPVPPEAPVGAWLEEVQRRLVELRRHEHSPLPRIRAWSAVPGGLPLFESLLGFENYQREPFEPQPELGLEVLEVRLRESTLYPLSVAIAPGSFTTVRVQYDRRRFDGATIVRLLAAFEQLAAGAAAAPERRLAELPLLAAAERMQLLHEWNDTAAALPAASLAELVAAWARRTPAAVAVAAGDAWLSYGELAARAFRLARRLRRSAVAAGEVVGLCAERSPDLAVAVVAVLAAGAAYLPLDPAYPGERLRFMVADAGVRTLLGHRAPLAVLQAAADPEGGAPGEVANHGGPRILDLATGPDADAAAGEPGGAAPLRPAAAESVAYVIYTSGSTGRPKGVAVPHRGLANLAAAQRLLFGLAPGCRVLQFAALGFDASVFEMALAWGAGGALVLAARGPQLAGAGLLAQLSGVSAAVLPPSALAELPAGELPGLATLVVAGEVCPPEVARRWAAGRQLWNAYGPTETAVCATAWRAGSALRGGRLPIGRPLANLRVHLLDAALQPVGIGGVGEIFIGGAGVARGYLGRPRLTAERFLPDPFGGSQGAGGGRLYRTGDLGRWLEDGELDFLGRADRQLKIRGFRIEPGEVEAALAAHPQVRAAAVVARPAAGGGRGEPRLVAYLATAMADPTLAAELRRLLRSRLPEHMVPAAFVQLPALPLTASGKVDHRALPAPPDLAPGAPGGAAGGAPRTPMEELLAAIWEELLGVARVGIDDSFFDLGGHSLLAVRALARLHQALGIDLPLRALFEAPAIAALAPVVEEAVRRGRGLATPRLGRAPHDVEPPLSFAQERLWFLDQLEPGNAAYNMPASLRLRGRLDVAALRAAFGELVRRHEVLRTGFEERGGRPWLRVRPRLAVCLPLLDLASLPAPARRAEGERLARQEALRPFRLAAAPLLRCSLVKLGASEHLALVTLHHIIADAWSIGVLARELGELYAAAGARSASPLPELPLQYADFARWQRRWLQGEALAAQLAWWRGQLGGDLPVLELPADRPRPAVQSFRGGQRPLRIAPADAAALAGVARRQGATLFMALLAVFQALLWRLGGQTDLVVGTPVANRRPETEGLIGLFLNTLALRGDLGGNLDYAGHLRRTREVAIGAYTHQDLPFEKLVQELHPQRDLSRSPLFQAMLVLLNVPRASLALGGLEILPLPVPAGTAKFDLSLSLAEADGALEGALEYSAELFDVPTVERLLGQLAVLLAAAAAAPHQPLAELPLLGAAERQQLREWNDTAADWPTGSLLHQLVERQARRSPEAVAVAADGIEEALTYGELEVRAGRLAGALRARGVGPETVVAVCCERCCALVVGLVAILKAGGAYLPLDPEHPRARLAAMLADAGAPLLLTRRALAAELRVGAAGTLCLDDPALALPLHPEGGTAAGAGADALAYVIYTSGSTGRPKGTMSSHRGIVNRLRWVQLQLPLAAADRVLQKTPLSFDVSVWELFWPLVAGARLVMARPGGHRDSAYLARAIARQGITVLHFVPAMLRAFLDHLAIEAPPSPALAGLRRVLASGEALSRDLERRHHQALPAPLHNLYGPTEAAVEVTHWACDPASPRQVVPIGRPLANCRIHLLDGTGREAPIGVAGELYIGGVQVGRGYLRRPDLTAERFVPDSFAGAPGMRLYRTGDVARWLADGAIHFLGRNDFQVKVRGVRVELGEVEAALRGDPAVGEAVVVAQPVSGAPGSAAGDLRLVAYVTPAAGGEATAEQLRERLRRQLPDAMVPAVFVRLPALPLTASGKVDRQALPATGSARPDLERRYVAPRSAEEASLAAVWSEVLGVDRVGVHDNFFALGGDSILSIQIVSRALRRGLRLTAKLVFQHQTVAELAAAAAAAAPAATLHEAAGGAAPLAPIQAWFFERQVVDPQHWNQAVLLASDRPLDVAILRRVLRELVAHHDALRMRFSAGPQGFQQEAAPVERETLARLDLSALAGARQRAAVEAAAAALQGSLDLARGPLLRAASFGLGANRQERLLLVIHHLVVDGVSWRILLEDLVTAYDRLSGGEPAGLGLRTTPFLEWARRLLRHARSAAVRAEAPHWRSLLSAAGPPMPTDRQAGANLVAAAETVVVGLAAEETRLLLQEVPRRYRGRVDDVLLAALATAFCGWTGELSVLVDLEGHGREEIAADVDLSRTVGWFTALFPVRLRPRPGDPAANLKAIKEQLRAVPNRGLGFGLLRHLGEPDLAAELRRLPPADVSFNYLGQLDQALPSGAPLHAADESSGPPRSLRGLRPHLLEITCSVAAGRLHAAWTYCENLHRRATVERLARSFVDSLRRLITHCSAPGAWGCTPSDFPLARLDQAALDGLLAGDRDVDDLYPLSPMQQGILFHSLYAPGSAAYFNQLSCQLHGALDPAAFRAAWREVMDRQPILRTAFLWQGLEQPLQVVRRHAEPPWDERDWRRLDDAEQRRRREEFLAADCAAGLDLQRAPLMRMALFRLAESSWQFTWTHHHLLMDGWSLPVLFQEVWGAYARLAEGRPPAAARPAPFRDYVAWLQAQDQDRAEAFWRRYLAGFTAPTRLAPWPAAAAGGAAEPPVYGAYKIVLSGTATAALQAFGRRHQLTQGTLVQAAWALLAGRHGASDDVVFGIVVAGRPPELPGVESMIGPFINALPVRVALPAHAELVGWLRRLQEQLLELRRYEHSSLAQIQGWSEVPRGQPLFESSLAFDNYPVAALAAGPPGGIAMGEGSYMDWNSYPLSFDVAPGPRLAINAKFKRRRFDEAAAERLTRELELLLTAIPAGAGEPLAALRALLDEEDGRQRAGREQRYEDSLRRRLKLKRRGGSADR